MRRQGCSDDLLAGQDRPDQCVVGKRSTCCIDDGNAWGAIGLKVNKRNRAPVVLRRSLPPRPIDKVKICGMFRAGRANGPLDKIRRDGGSVFMDEPPNVPRLVPATCAEPAAFVCRFDLEYRSPCCHEDQNDRAQTACRASGSHAAVTSEQVGQILVRFQTPAVWPTIRAPLIHRIFRTFLPQSCDFFTESPKDQGW